MLFAVVMDVLLRAIPIMVDPDTHHRAFADDIGVILTDITTQLPKLAAMLSRFGKISGMIVNIKKTILIPLWPDSRENHRQVVASAAPTWADVPIDDSAIYLGVRIGPGKSGSEWETAAKRLMAKLRG